MDMFDEDSFVILGTSPMASLEPDGINGAAGDKMDSMQKDTPPGSRFASLKNSQINELENARKALNETPTPSTLSNSNGVDQSMTKQRNNALFVSASGTMERPVESNTAVSISASGTMERSAESNTAVSISARGTMDRSAESLLWSRPQVEPINIPKSALWDRPQVEVTEDFIPLRLDDSAPPSPLTQSPKVSLTSRPTQATCLNPPTSRMQNSNKENLQPTLETLGKNIAALSVSASGTMAKSTESKSTSSLIASGTKENPTENNTASSVSASGTMERSAEMLLWSRPQVDPTNSPQPGLCAIPQVKDDFVPFSLEDCAVPTSLTQSPKTSLTSRQTQATLLNSPTSHMQNSNKENLQPSLETVTNMANSQNSKGASSKNSSLATSFIMGEVNADVLKTSVYSQFPSITMQACPEDVVKLQNMVTEYMQLKTTLEKVNNTMKLFYENSMQWKDKMNHMECHYKQQLDECQRQIHDLRAENQNLMKCIEEQVEQTKAVDVARQNDRDEMIRTISEKSALVENMRAMVVKLEEQQNATFEFLPNKSKDKKESNFDTYYITRGEHELQVKDLKRQLSEMLASNLDLKDVEKQYIDELNCLKLNATSIEELVQLHRDEITELQVADAAKLQKIYELQKSNQDILVANSKQNDRILHLEQQNQDLLLANSEQNERILVLEHQNVVYCKDFQMERESRQNAVGEKQQILQDLRALQKRNQELIEEHQMFVENYEKRVSNTSVGSGFGSATTPLVAAAAAAQTYINNPQRPIRDLPSSQSAMPTQAFDSSNQYNCPVCNKRFKSISVLTSHVNDCIDKN